MIVAMMKPAKVEPSKSTELTPVVASVVDGEYSSGAESITMALITCTGATTNMTARIMVAARCR
ncbi:hypothetical protein D3C83_319610 [compost metagenome]